MLKMRSAKLLLLLFTSSFFLMAHVYLRTYKHKGRHAYTIHMYTYIPTPHKRNTHTHTQPSNTWTFVYKIDFIDFIYIKNEILKSKWNHVRSHTHTHFGIPSVIRVGIDKWDVDGIEINLIVFALGTQLINYILSPKKVKYRIDAVEYVVISKWPESVRVKWVWWFGVRVGYGRRLDPHLEHFYGIQWIVEWMMLWHLLQIQHTADIGIQIGFEMKWNYWNTLDFRILFAISCSLSLSISLSTQLNRFEKQSNTHSMHMKTQQQQEQQPNTHVSSMWFMAALR